MCNFIGYKNQLWSKYDHLGRDMQMYFVKNIHLFPTSSTDNTAQHNNLITSKFIGTVSPRLSG